jgi:membrane dipeptidase
MLPYIDMHCDTLGLCLKGERDIFRQPKAMLDIERMARAGQMAQFFAVFFRPREDGLPEDEEYFRLHRQLLTDSVDAHAECIAMAYSADDIRRNHAHGKMSAVLTVEDGRAVRGDMERLRGFYEEGVRVMALTWNFPNCFGSPNSPDERVMRAPLTPFGRRAVEAMNALGMIIDVSHLSDGGFYDIADISSKPFVATHSNCRALSPHPRNLTDDMIRRLSDSGGVAGLNFYAPFLSGDILAKRSRVEDMCRHVLHMLRVGGEDCIALGTDFDGMDGEFEIDCPTKVPLLFEALHRQGLTPRQLEKFASGNVLRVMQECL